MVPTEGLGGMKAAPSKSLTPVTAQSSLGAWRPVLDLRVAGSGQYRNSYRNRSKILEHFLNLASSDHSNHMYASGSSLRSWPRSGSGCT